MVASAYVFAAQVIWKALTHAFGRIWPFVQPIFALLTAAAKVLGETIGAVWASIFGALGRWIDGAIERIKLLTGFFKGARGAFDDASARLSGGGPGAPAGLPEGRAQLAAAGAAPLAATSSAAIAASRTSNRNTRLRVDNLTVHTQATDAKGMARAATGALGAELRRAQADNEDGVER